MPARDNLHANAIVEILNRIHRLEVSADLGFASISRGSLRVASNEGLKVEGSARVDGWLIVLGTERVTGLLEILGELTGSGDFRWTGDVYVTGPTRLAGPLRLIGNATLEGDLTLTTGKIFAGTATLEQNRLLFSTGARVENFGTGIGLLATGSGRVVATNGNAEIRYGTRYVSAESDGIVINGPTLVQGDHQITGSKQFVIPHPTKPGKRLHHASTESPVSGIEYWGHGTIDEHGEATIELPEYFEALAKPEGRAVLVTPRGFIADWTDIEDGAFTVTGEPGKPFTWLVKAERFGGDFDLESDARGAAA